MIYDCPHFNTPAVIEDMEKYPNGTFWENRLNDLDELIPWVPLEVYLFAKAHGYDIVKKTIFNGNSTFRSYLGIYKVYIVRKSNERGYAYILVNDKEIKFYNGKYSEIESCFPIR